MIDDHSRAFLAGLYRHHPESPGNPHRVRRPAAVSAGALESLRQLDRLNDRRDAPWLALPAEIDELVDAGLVTWTEGLPTRFVLTSRARQALEGGENAER